MACVVVDELLGELSKTVAHALNEVADDWGVDLGHFESEFCLNWGGCRKYHKY